MKPFFASLPLDIDPPFLIDSHCHLDDASFDATRSQVVNQALTAGIAGCLVPAVSAQNFEAVLAMRQCYGCWVALGLHPIYHRQHLDEHLALLKDYLARGEAMAVGEIGLDAWFSEADLPRQEVLLIEQLKLARQFNLPVILHLRRAQDRVLKYLRQFPVVGGIAHAFNGSQQQAEAFIKLGFKLGFGGAMTYQGSARIRYLAATLPAECLVLETDAPDMPPAWASQPPNSPVNLRRYAQLLAELRQTDFSSIAQITSYNAIDALAGTQDKQRLASFICG